MKLTPDEARARLAANHHGVLCTLHPERGADPQPVSYALSAGRHVGLPIDKVKPKSSSRLRRAENLAADPRGTLLVEHWDAEDWSKLWWVRAELRYVENPPAALTDELADLLAATVPQYADKPFHRILVCSVEAVTGWSASGDQAVAIGEKGIPRSTAR